MLAAIALGLAFVLPARLPSSRAGLHIADVARAGRPVAELEQLSTPQDDLRPRFSRGDDDAPKTSFTPDYVRSAPAKEAPTAAAPPRASANAQLLAEIRAMQPQPLPPAPEKKAIDLNGIQPKFLLLGAASYMAFAVVAWQFTNSAADYFAANPFESSYYVVQRLSSIARVVVVALGSLGAGITSIAGLGQLALAVQVAIGISKGELDPNKPRVDPYGGRKKGELEKMLGFMLGDKEAGMDNADTRL